MVKASTNTTEYQDAFFDDKYALTVVGVDGNILVKLSLFSSSSSNSIAIISCFERLYSSAINVISCSVDSGFSFVIIVNISFLMDAGISFLINVISNRFLRASSV